MQWGWEAPGCHGNGLGLSKMAALSAWVPSCLACGGGKRDIKGWGERFTPLPEEGNRASGEGGAGLRVTVTLETHWGLSPTPSWQLGFGLPKHLERSAGRIQGLESASYPVCLGG